MKLLIKQARVVDPLSPFNGQITDILIENGIIAEIGKKITTRTDQEIGAENLHLSPGWVDLFADFADPGYEFKETLESGAAAAAAGGYTDVLLIPNTNPPIHNKAGIEYLIQKNRSLPVNIHPIGAVTVGTEGKELAEMYDMKASGAVAFSDGIHCIQSSGLLLKALQYVKAFDGIIIQLPDDKSINPHGLMNEGIISTRMGLPGKPPMAEELMVARDIQLCSYANSRLHYTAVSTSGSLEQIKKAKETGVEVSCSVTPYHLFFCDDDLEQYDSNLKVNPPIRSKEERNRLREAISDGTIDCIASHHLPHEYDSKVVEFEYAKYGMIGLETAFSALKTSVPSIALEKVVMLLSTNPRKLFRLGEATVRKDQPATLTLFDPDKKWTLTEKDIRSRSKNSPFTGKELTGKVIGIINGDKIIVH